MKKFISFLLAAVLLVSAVPTALATNDYSQGTQVVYQATGSESYTITVPALLAPGSNGTVTLQGTWAENRIITVTAEPTVTLTNSIKAEDQKVLNVHFDGISEAGSNTGSQTFTESVSVDNITNALFGTWSGKFNYNVDVADNANIINPELYAPIANKYAPKNMLDISTLTEGKAIAIDNGNTLVNAAAHSASEIINVEPEMTYVLSTPNATSFRTIYLLDDGTTQYQVLTCGADDVQITMPTKCIGFRISGETEIIKEITIFPKSERTVAFNGDSITELPYGWASILSDYYYWDELNYAIGGSALANYDGDGTPSRTRDPLVDRYTSMDVTADMCMIAIGTNDFNYSWCDIGTDTDDVTTTFKGALHTLCNGLKEMYGNKPIIFVTPIKRGPILTNSYGKTLEDYANAIVDVCSQYDGIYVIDLYHTCPLDPNIAEHQEQFFDGNLNSNEGYTYLYDDQTHPNVYGARVQARYIIDELEPILEELGLI